MLGAAGRPVRAVQTAARGAYMPSRAGESSPWARYARQLYTAIDAGDTLAKTRRRSRSTPTGALASMARSTATAWNRRRTCATITAGAGAANVVETWLECLDLATWRRPTRCHGALPRRTPSPTRRARAAIPWDGCRGSSRCFDALPHPPEFVAWFVDEDVSRRGRGRANHLPDGV